MVWSIREESGITILEINCPDTPVNILTSSALMELKEKLTALSTRSDLKALIISSAKEKIFIAGADINEINGITTKKDAIEKADAGKEVFKILEDIKAPTLAAINGACLGGGCELALACDYRVAAHGDQVKIGLPEVNLGILPGFGGSIRMPLKLGLLTALPLILSGKMLSGREALKKGLVDKLFPDATLLSESIHFMKDQVLQGRKPKLKRKKGSPLQNFMEKTPLGRMIVFNQARKNVKKKTKGFYPAPLEIIDLIEKTYGDASAKSYALESEHFSKLADTQVSKNLIKLFFASEKYKKLKWTESGAKPRPVKKCAVVGAGVMGGGIAQRVSYKNIPVRVRDIQEEALQGALQEASRIYQDSVKRRRLQKADADFKMGLISVGLTLQGFKRADLIIEAVVENMDIKKKVFQELSDTVSEETIIASNTSSLSISEMASVVKNPGRVLGIHFFNPVNRMPLVEIIRGRETTDETIETAVQFARSLGKTVIVVKDKEGFLVNRLLLPYLNEAAYLLEEGVSPEILDEVATKFGMPMGPITLVDQVGIDVAYKVAQILENTFGERMKVAGILERVYKKGLLGKKKGLGFYKYSGKNKVVNDEVLQGINKSSVPNRDEVLKRMLYVMINEACHCLDEGVVDSAQTVDIGMLFGTGFPPFRCGLLSYADEIGPENLLSALKEFQKSINGARFEPSNYLVNLVEKKSLFYPST